MKLNLIRTILVVLFLASYSLLYGQDKIKISGHGNSEYTHKTSNGIKSTEVEYRGTIVFNNSDTDVESISSGGFLRISQKTFGTRRTVLLEGRSDGTITRTFKIGSSEEDWEPEGARWLADVLLDVIRSTGLGAETRVKRFYTKGGIQAVLDEIDEIGSDYVQVIYFTEAVKLGGLSTSDINSLIEEASDNIGSDFELGRFYIDNSDYFMKNNSSVLKVMESTSEISSDFEQARVLIHYIKEHDLTDEQMKQVVVSSTEISSDFEHARVLKTLLEKEKLNEQVLEALLETIDDISSDYEASNVLQVAINNQNMNSKSISLIIEASDDIGSDFEQARVLKALINLELSNENLVSVAKATENISSDFEKSGVLVSILGKNNFDEKDLAIVINASSEISSDFEHAKVLSYIIGQGEMSDQNFQAITEATKNIGSSYERSRVLKALIKENDLNAQKSIWLLEAVESISGNFDKAGVMIEMGPKIPNSDAVYDAFRNTAKTITSDYDYGRVMRSVSF